VQRRFGPIDQADAVNNTFTIGLFENGFQRFWGHRSFNNPILAPTRGTAGAFQIANTQEIDIEEIRLPKKFHDGTQLDLQEIYWNRTRFATVILPSRSVQSKYFTVAIFSFVYNYFKEEFEAEAGISRFDSGR